MSKINYKFEFNNSKILEFLIDLNRNQSIDLSTRDDHTEWTNLSYHKCENCPLDDKIIKKCPAALDVKEAMNHFKDVLSTDIIKTSVETENRTYLKTCDAQTALKSLLGVVMATSGCPILGEMKGIAYFHLPFASLEETIFRTISAYLLKQYFNYKSAQNSDWNLEKIPDFFEKIQNVNLKFFERIKIASKADANLNAIVSFSSQSQIFSFDLD